MPTPLSHSQEEMEGSKRKIEQFTKGEPKAMKLNQTNFCEPLSDSENEEPFQVRAAHRSAFISKGSTQSLTSLAGNTNTRAVRSQSCNDNLKDSRTKSRRKASHSNKAKTSSVINASAAGVLLSTENSRSFSAPDLTSEKRPSGSLSYSTPQKPERSISPESNDSISEELNHFKPIVCSPCTPPKKLPNGKVLRPVIIKSTPRNLQRNLQSPTSYETSPRVLLKWDSIFQDRQTKKTLSQGTLTCFPTVPAENIPAPGNLRRERLVVKLPEGVPLNKGSPNLPSINSNLGRSKSNESSEPLIAQDHTFLLPDVVSCKPSKKKPSENNQSCSESDANVNYNLGDLQVCRVNCDKCTLASQLECKTGTISFSKTKGKRLRRHRNNCQLINLQNGTCGSPTSQWRSPKKHYKTKHLDQKGAPKRLKQTTNDSDSLVDKPLLEREGKLWQEEKDRKLAFRLHREFSSDINSVNRQRGSQGQYLLRSSSTTHAST